MKVCLLRWIFEPACWKVDEEYFKGPLWKDKIVTDLFTITQIFAFLKLFYH